LNRAKNSQGKGELKKKKKRNKPMKNRLRGGEENNLAEGYDSAFGFYQRLQQLAFLVAYSLNE